MRFSPVLLLVLLAGCARDDTAYPSLAPRAAEKLGFDEPAVAPLAPVVADPTLDRRLADLGTRLGRIVAGYDTDALKAERAASAAGARTTGSEAWVAAQSALAALDDWRAQTGGVATELDDLSRERTATVGTAYPPLDALRDRASRQADRETAQIAALGARVPTP